jgi:thioredoxin 2
VASSGYLEIMNGLTGDLDHVVYPCARCGQANRIQRARLRHDPICGRCKQKVFPGQPVEVRDATWRQEVEDCPIPVLVDLWAPWCGPCRALAPALERIANERAGRLKVAKVNVDENPGTAARLGVRSIPTLLVLRGPLEVDRIVGALPKAELDLRLERVL